MTSRALARCSADENHVVENKAQAASQIADQLREWLQAPKGADGLRKISNRIDALKIKDAQGTRLAVEINSYFDQAKSHIDSAIDSLSREGSAKPAPFQLFEIRMRTGHGASPGGCRFGASGHPRLVEVNETC